MSILITAIAILILIYLRANIFTILISLSLLSALFLGMNISQIHFLLETSLKRIVKTDELIVIPFLLLLSELIIRARILDNFILYFIKKRIPDILKYYLIFTLTSALIPSSVLANRFMIRFLNIHSRSNKSTKIRYSQFFTIFCFISPLSVPILIYNYLLRLSLKTTIFYFFLLSTAIYAIGYFLLLKNNLPKLKTNNKNIKSSDAIFVIFIILFTYYKLAVPYPLLQTISQSLILAVLYYFWQRKTNFRINALIMKNVVLRSGVIISILILLFFTNLLITYGSMDTTVTNFIASFLTDKFLIIVIMFFISFILLQFIDPIAVLIISYPFYKILIVEYNLNKYIFGMGYIIFISLGFFSYIKNLTLENYINKLKINYEQLNKIFLPQMMLFALFSILIMVMV